MNPLTDAMKFGAVVTAGVAAIVGVVVGFFWCLSDGHPFCAVAIGLVFMFCAFTITALADNMGRES